MSNFFQGFLSNFNVYVEMVINDRSSKYNQLNKGTRISYCCEEGSCQIIQGNFIKIGRQSLDCCLTFNEKVMKIFIFLETVVMM